MTSRLPVLQMQTWLGTLVLQVELEAEAAVVLDCAEVLEGFSSRHRIGSLELI